MGEDDGKITFRQILISAQLLIFATLTLTFIAPTGKLYFALAIILGLGFYHIAYQASISRSKLAAKRLLHASVIYLPLLYLLIVLDKLDPKMSLNRSKVGPTSYKHVTPPG